jgi:hypothetical protein
MITKICNKSTRSTSGVNHKVACNPGLELLMIHIVGKSRKIEI